MKRRKIMTWLLSMFGVVLLCTLLLVARSRAQEPPVTGDSYATLAAEIALRGNVPLILELDIPGIEGAMAAGVQEAMVADAQASVLGRIAGHNPINIKTYPYIPHLALTVHNEEALAALFADPAVSGIVLDRPVPPLVADTIPRIGAQYAQILFYEGDGQAVAVLDTGVDRFHGWLSGKIVSEACYSTNNAGMGAASVCPGGAASSTATNSGLNCSTSISGCDHGTHVASTAAAVAPRADIIALQVFSRFTDGGANSFCSNSGRTSPCSLSFASDQLSALQRVLALQNQANGINVASVNMSLGSGKYTSTCTVVGASYLNAVTALRNANIAVVVSAGNSGYTNAMGSPGCISNVISVGATDKSDLMASYSNISNQTTLLAPGSNVIAAIPGNTTDEKSGTSMAAPHVAGAFAVLRAASPNSSVSQLQSLLVSTGVSVPDQRTNGNVDNKRRIYVYGALCALITCDGDDFRNLILGQAQNGTVNPGTDRDHFFYQAQAGNRLTLTLNRVSGSVDPYLELYDPDGTRVAINNNGGGGVNALINNYLLQRTGRYMIVARSAGTAAGTYALTASQQAVALNPVPYIRSISPASATANPFASDFWVAIRGYNFMPASQVRLGGSLRPSSYSSSNLVYVRVRGSDIRLSPSVPRTASIRVTNPAPGGGVSNVSNFQITFPFLGASELVQPVADSTLETDIKTSFVLSWTVPVTETTWRIMQHMDLRLRDETGRVAASIRVVEHPGSDSVYQVLNEVGEPVTDEIGNPVQGLPGAPLDIVLTDTVTLHLAESAFVGSGLTAIMTPTLTFGPNATGTWNVEFRVDKTVDEEGSLVQDDDVLGQITIVPPSCPAPVTGVSASGPAMATTGADVNYTATIDPLAATMPVTYTWAPEPKSGQGTPNATYNWESARQEVIFVSVENCGGFAADFAEVAVATGPAPDLAVSKQAAPVALAGEPITYTLTVTNSGEMTATNVLVVDELPAGATWIAGGMLNGSEVVWQLPALPGFGATAQFTFVASSSATITNSTYRVQADGSINVAGTPALTTEIVDAHTMATALQDTMLAYDHSGGKQTMIGLPAGVVANPTQVAADELPGPSYMLPDGKESLGRAFTLRGYRGNQPVPDFALGEVVSMTLGLDATLASVAGASPPELYWWTGSNWSNEGTLCAMADGLNSVECSVANPPATEYVLVQQEEEQPQPPGPESRVLLPMIQR